MNVSIRKVFVAEDDQPDRLKDLDVVRLRRPVEDEDGRVIAAGTEGTIVATYAAGAAFEVEFTRALEALVTVRVEDLELVNAR